MSEGVVLELLELVRVLKQGEYAVADKVDGGLVPRDQEQEDHAEQLVLRELVTRLLRPHQRAHQVVSGVRALLLEEGVQVVSEGLHVRDEHLLQVFLGGIARDSGVGPLAEGVPVFCGHAEQLGYDGDRQGEGVVVDQVHLAPVLDRVQQPVGYRLHARAHSLDQARRESSGDQRPQALVVGWVHVEHVPAQRLHHRGYRRDLGELLGGESLAPVLYETRVFQDGQDVVVAGDQPHAPAIRQLDTVDRGVGA
jgi:hypothetical protein